MTAFTIKCSTRTQSDHLLIELSDHISETMDAPILIRLDGWMTAGRK